MKTAEEILENNSLIAEFMGLELQDDGTYYDADVNECINVENLCYNESWDMLMPVVNTIAEKTNSTLVMGAEYARWESIEGGLTGDFGGYADISNIYTACIEFIKWHTTHQNKH